ncbi:hypothetical protein NC651_017126 [Populus alba x Populus x berolinensis]|nr:hypothetical protein NC651_017126 [Populus alba x Populus x berolinensis]
MVDVCDKSEDLGYATLLFKQVKESNEYLYNAMIRAYAHNVEVFDGMIERDSISWNGLYSILDSNDIRGTRAQMQIVGIEPDNISIISASPASRQPEALEVERDTHVL